MKAILEILPLNGTRTGNLSLKYENCFLYLFVGYLGDDYDLGYEGHYLIRLSRARKFYFFKDINENIEQNIEIGESQWCYVHSPYLRAFNFSSLIYIYKNIKNRIFHFYVFLSKKLIFTKYIM